MSRETEDQDPEEEVQEENTSEEENVDESELDLPTALEKLEETSRKLRTVNKESAGRRKKIKELEDQIKAFTDNGDDATKKLGKAMADLDAARDQLRSFELRDKFDQAAVTAKVAWAHESAKRDAFVFAEKTLQSLPEDAEDQDFVDAVKDVVKSRPYLLIKPKSKEINSENKGPTDALVGLDLESIGRDFGINS